MNIMITNLTFVFPSGKHLFDNRSIDLSGPGFYFLTGKNGVGKSTLARIISGLTSPHEKISGTISFDHAHYDLSAQATRNFLYEHVAYVSQRTDDMVAPHFTARENMALAALPRYPGLGILKKYDGQIFGIPMDIPAKNISGGQRQLLSIAMMLQKKPLILILDEPTAALDEQNAIMIMDTIKTLSAQILCICICHDEELIARYARGKNIRL